VGRGEALAYFSKNILFYGTLRRRCTGREFGNMSVGLDLRCSVEDVAVLTLAVGSDYFKK
jgi:hypothetical protein